MNKNWVVVLSSVGAKIFEVKKGTKHWKKVDVLTHPEGRAHNKDLDSDRPGRIITGPGASSPHSYSKAHTSKEQENAKFAKKVADFLKEAKNHHLFDQAILVVAPSFEHYFGRYLENGLSKCVKQIIHKNYFNQSEQETFARLKENIHYSFPA